MSTINVQTDLSDVVHEEIKVLRALATQQAEKKFGTELKKYMKLRFGAHERYTSEDCVLILNSPFDAKRSQDVTANALIFSKNFGGFKACV